MSRPDNQTDPLTPEDFAALSSDLIGGRYAQDGPEARRLDAHCAADAVARQQHNDDTELAVLYRELTTMHADVDESHLGDEIYYSSVVQKLKVRLGKPDPDPDPQPPQPGGGPQFTPWRKRLAYVSIGAAAAWLLALGVQFIGQNYFADSGVLPVAAGLAPALPVLKPVSVRELSEEDNARFQYLANAQNWEHWSDHQDYKPPTSNAEYEQKVWRFNNYADRLRGLPEDGPWKERCNLMEDIAQVAIELGLYDEAENWLSASLATCRAAEESTDRQERELELLTKLGRFELALHKVESLMGRDGLSERSQRYLQEARLKLLMRQGKYREVENAALKLAEKRQDQAKHHLLFVARAREHLGDWRGAREAYSQMRDAMPASRARKLVEYRINRLDHAQELAVESVALAQAVGRDAPAADDTRLAVNRVTNPVQTVGLWEKDVQPAMINRLHTQAIDLRDLWQPHQTNAAAYLGLRLERPSVLCDTRKKGIRIADVAADSAAEKMGLKVGDRIVALDEHTIGGGELDLYKLVGLIRNAEPNAPIRLTVIRDGEEMTMEGTLGQMP